MIAASCWQLYMYATKEQYMNYAPQMTWTMLCLGIMKCILVNPKTTSDAQANCDKVPLNVILCK